MNDIECPQCGAPEMHPAVPLLVIRALKVCIEGIWHSQCLRCSGLWDAELTQYSEKNHNPEKGWFTIPQA